MKLIKIPLIIIAFIASAFFFTYFLVNTINDDLYDRLIENHEISELNPDIPTFTLVIKKFLVEENCVEASLVLNYEKSLIFKKFNSKKLNFDIIISDRYYYNPSGLNYKFNFNDSIDKETFGYLKSGFETDNFKLPFAPSINGYPFDKASVFPYLNLYINGTNAKFNYVIQERIPGKTLQVDKKKGVILLSRTNSEIILVLISSIIFIFLTIILTYKLVKKSKGLNTIEELIMIASYIIGIAGFREILGLSRDSGTGVLEIFVILVPLVSVFIGLIFSYYKGLQTKK